MYSIKVMITFYPCNVLFHGEINENCVRNHVYKGCMVLATQHLNRGYNFVFVIFYRCARDYKTVTQMYLKQKNAPL